MIVAQYWQSTERQMYTFVMDNLVKLEQGFLAGTEERAGSDGEDRLICSSP